MIIEFEGITSGDYECFCFDVDKETFEKFNSKEDLDFFNESKFNKGMYRLYPNDILGDVRGKVKVKIEIEKIGEP